MTDESTAAGERLLGSLSLEQKVRLLTGADSWSLHPEPAVGLRRIVLSDGPVGVRGETWDERRTAVLLPSPTALAASWDETLAGRLGALLAAEARRQGVDVLLAPTVNLHRSPLGGRHFECYSEDPVLTARIGIAYVRGLQAHGVAATPKHYVANDSETDRYAVDVRMDERALRELYLAPFEQLVVEGGAWLVMAAYNSVDGVTMTENDLLQHPLKDEWGFDGVVVSDWTAARSTEPAARAALDLVMPGPTGPWGDSLVAAVRAGTVPESAIDDKVRRLLRLAARVGALDGAAPRHAPLPPAPAEVAALVREASASGMVLVRNEGLLPLAAPGLRRVALIGPGAAEPRLQGGGSAALSPQHEVSPLAGLRAALGREVEVGYALGARTRRGLQPFTPDQVSDPETGEAGLRLTFRDAAGAALASEHRESGRLRWAREGLPRDAARLEIGARFRARSAGVHRFGVAGLGRYRLTAGPSVLVDETIELDAEDPATAFFDPPRRSGAVELADGEVVELALAHDLIPGLPAMRLTFGVEAPALADEGEIARAAALAKDADVAVVVVCTGEEIEREGVDRRSLALPGAQDDLVRAVAAANPRTAVVVNAGAPVTLPWREAVPAILLAWFPGQEFGHALADVLLGVREPGGRLPTTWAGREDAPVLTTQPVDGVLRYAEGIHLGYRGWLRDGLTPAYPFGHGLGYTTWAYEAISPPANVGAGEGADVRVRLRNTGGRAGREVVQVYLSRPASAVERPVRWLAGFAAVSAAPGEEAEAVVRLAPRAFQHWADGGWRTEAGDFEVQAGRSVVDVPLQTRIAVTA